MQTGKLDQHIVLKQPTTVNSGGQVVETYTTVATVWAEILTQRGNEAFEAARVNAQRVIRARIRYRTDILTTWVCEWQGVEYNITEVDRSQRRAGALWFTAQAKGVT